MCISKGDGLSAAEPLHVQSLSATLLGPLHVGFPTVSPLPVSICEARFDYECHVEFSPDSPECNVAEGKRFVKCCVHISYRLSLWSNAAFASGYQFLVTTASEQEAQKLRMSGCRTSLGPLKLTGIVGKCSVTDRNVRAFVHVQGITLFQFELSAFSSLVRLIK